MRRICMTKNNIPAGYKDSAVGIIPLEWEVKKVKSICNIDANSLSSKTSPDYEFDYISLSDVDNDSFEVIKSHQLFKTAPSRARRIVKRNDVVISTVRPNLQGFFMIKNDVEDLIVSTGFSVLSPIKCNPYYLLVYFFSEAITKQFYSLVVGSNYPAVNSSDVANLKIACPTLIEQQKIVEILRTWDEAIEKQSKLIKALEKRKKALIQLLLTGRVRLPGYTKKWKRIKIENVANEYSVRNYKQLNLIVLSCTKYNGLVSSLNYFGKQIYSNDLSSYKIVPKKHFAYATNHIDEGSIGYQNDYDKALISPMYTVFKTNSIIINDDYLYMLMKTDYMIYKYKSLMEGSIDRRGGLHWKSFASIEIKLPPIEEQEAIANIMVSADNEIKHHQAKLNQLRKQKQGLMQQLLTGKKRVK